MQVLRGLGLFVAIACLVWVGVLWHWQETQRDMSTQDILLYLGALPFTLFVLVVASAWAWRGASGRLAAPTAAAPAPGGAAAAPIASSSDAQARHASAQLLLAHAATGAGSTIDELIEAAQAGMPRPAPDAELRDAQGLPVMAARARDVDTTAVAQHLQALQAKLGPQVAAAPAGEALLRALTLLATQLGAMVNSLAPWSARLHPPAPPPGQPAVTLPSRVRLLAAWPTGTPEPQRALAQAWLRDWLRSRAAGTVDPDAWLLQPTTAQTDSGPELWQEADRLLTTLAREGVQDLVVLTACHSDLDAAAVAALDDAGALFGAARPKGVMPGEGAAVLVLAGPSWPPAQDDAAPTPHLHRAALARRDKSVDAPGRVSADLAGELLRQSLAAAQAEPGAVHGLASDADQHSPRGAEALGAALAQLPDLDAGEDLCTAGHLSGRTGAVATLVTVAMAAQRSVQTRQHWAALSVADPHWRLALLARPDAPPPSTNTTPADPAARKHPTAA